MQRNVIMCLDHWGVLQHVTHVMPLSGLRVRGGSEELHYWGQDSAQLSQRRHHQTAAHGWAGGRWDAHLETHKHSHTKDSRWYLGLFSASVSLLLCSSCHVCHAVCVSAYVHVCGVCVFRQTLRLHSEEEGHASGGAEERHSWVWWVWQGCYICCVCVCVCIAVFFTLVGLGLF